ncbi:MAG TPA: MopE-related protein [Polyangiaceae bacterium]|nr:MopE-related protein [Polyangiaceae bacterium]
MIGRSIAAVAALLALASLTGCDTDAYCFDCGRDDGGAPDAGSGEGGGGGGAGGSGGEGGSIITIDSGTCGDIETDPQNCGACGLVCNLPNAFPKCEEGFCLVGTCAAGWVDLNMAVMDGCEYKCAPSNGGSEICDGIDNDCNGQVDELTDKSTDPVNCGACSNVCVYTNAGAVCQGGACSMGACFVGYNDVNQSDADGCEYACTQTNGGVEACDLADNDCDGQVDETFTFASDPKNCGSCGNDCTTLYPNTVGTCTASVCELGPCVPGYYDLDANAANGCEYACSPAMAGAEQCDGQDNDCDGLVDEGMLPSVGMGCGASSVGECALGALVCSGGSLVCQGEVTPSTEVCDSLDNDCSGASDEGCPVAQAADKRLDAGASSGVGQAPSTQLNVAAKGDVVVATYLDRRLGNADIFANVSTDGGSTWLAADVTVASGALTQVEPWAMLSPTAAYIVFEEFPVAAHRDVYIARAPAPYTAYGAKTRVDKTAGTADAFLVRAVVAQAGAQDTIVVVWESLTGTGANVKTDVLLQRSTNNGVTWSAVDLRVNAVQGTAELPAIATDGSGKVFIAWRDQRAGKSEVYADVFDAAAGTLSGNKAISAGQPAEQIAIAADEGGPNVYVAWTDLRAAKKVIRLNRSGDGGATFGADGVIVNPDATFADATSPALAAKAGRVVVAWEDTRSGPPDIRVNHSEDAGASFLPATSRADRGDAMGSAATRPSVAFGSDDLVFVAWEDARNGERDIYANHSFDKGTTFQPNDLRLDVGAPGAPSPPGGADSRSPFIATNATGKRGLVVWIDNRTTAGATGVNADIYSSFFQ